MKDDLCKRQIDEIKMLKDKEKKLGEEIESLKNQLKAVQ
jgi:hypothetical protein